MGCGFMRNPIFDTVAASVSIVELAEAFGYTVNRNNFIFSPFNSSDRTASCKLYSTNTFFDFSTSKGGDVIKFASEILKINNWEACQYLIEKFNLPVLISDHKQNRETIQKQEAERLKQQQKEEHFKQAWKEEVDKQKKMLGFYKELLDRKIFPPLSTENSLVVSKVQIIEYKLDVLCGILGTKEEQEQILREAGYIW